MARISPSRRRQRSVRVTVAVSLMATGTAAVILGLSLSGDAVLNAASVLAVACGWAAARIIHTELEQSRRAHSRDRAAQARAFGAVFAERSAQHAALVCAMAARLAARERQVRELEGTLRVSERRVVEAQERVRRASRCAAEAQERVGELEAALAVRTAEGRSSRSASRRSRGEVTLRFRSSPGTTRIGTRGR